MKYAKKNSLMPQSLKHNCSTFRHIVRKRNSLEKNVMHMNEQKRSFLRVRSVDGLKSRKGAHHRNLSGSQSIIKS